MIFTTHAIAGAAVAKLFSTNPAAAFIAAFLSHFILDAIPHRDYNLLSRKINPSDPLNGDMVWGKKFIIDILKISIDIAAGITLSLLFIKSQSTYQTSVIIFGAIGGILPDGLHFLYWKLKIEPLRSIQKVHGWFHFKDRFKNRPVFLGLVMQAIIAAVIIIASRSLG